MDPKLKSKKERNIDKKNVDRIVAAEQAKVKKRQMKERTGNPEVDKLMEEFESVKGYKFGENIGKKDGGDLKIKGLAAPSIALQKLTEMEQLREEAKKLLSKKPTKKNAMGGKIQTEFRMGGKVDISNFKGQF